MARPFGPIRLALLQAAARGPGTVTELAHRSLVGAAAAKCTCSRLVAAGELVILSPGRPAVLALPTSEPAQQDDAAAALSGLLSGWGRGSV